MTNKERACALRKQGISIIKIANQLGVSKSSVSVWTRGVNLTQEQRANLRHREISNERALAHSNIFRIRRKHFQDKGKKRVRKNDPLYIAGCMLYWGEGAKNINQCKFANSELPMIKTFKVFLQKFFAVPTEKFSLDINAYTDLHSSEEIIKYWLDGLSLPSSAIKFTLWDQYPKSSKRKHKKSEWGTATLNVSSTEIVQEIFGAIQEFGSFKNEKWLG